MKTLCPECGVPIVGRSDKKYCDDGCRNSYNNKMNRDQNNFMRNINRIIRKNRKILLQMKQSHKDLDYLILLHLGFNFSYFTQCKITDGKIRRIFCYEIGIEMKEKDIWEIISLPSTDFRERMPWN